MNVCPLINSGCHQKRCEWWQWEDERCVIWGLMDIVNILADFIEDKEDNYATP